MEERLLGIRVEKGFKIVNGRYTCVIRIKRVNIVNRKRVDVDELIRMLAFTQLELDNMEVLREHIESVGKLCIKSEDSMGSKEVITLLRKLSSYSNDNFLKRGKIKVDKLDIRNIVDDRVKFGQIEMGADKKSDRGILGKMLCYIRCLKEIDMPLWSDLEIRNIDLSKNNRGSTIICNIKKETKRIEFLESENRHLHREDFSYGVEYVCECEKDLSIIGYGKFDLHWLGIKVKCLSEEGSIKITNLKAQNLHLYGFKDVEMVSVEDSYIENIACISE